VVQSQKIHPGDGEHWCRTHILTSCTANERLLRVFLITIPICIIAAGGLWIFLKLEPPEASFRVALRNLDWIGMVLSTGSIVTLLYGLTTGGHLNPWGSAKTVVPIVFGVLGIGGFIVFEAKITNPMIPPRMFANRTAAVGFLSSGLHGIIFWGTSFFFIQYVSGSLP
jgi:hypothetical protein